MKCEANTNAYVMPSATAKEIIDNGRKSYLKRNKLGKYRYICGAVNVDNNHWRLTVINTQLSTFTYLDPQGASDEVVLKAFNNWWYV